jgi:ATP-binding cassette subfamily B protein
MAPKITFRDVIEQILHLDRPVRLVWNNARGWTAVQLGLVIVQGLLPLAGLYLTKRIVDSVATGFSIGDISLALRQTLFWVGFAAVIALFSTLSGSLSDYVQEVQTMRVTDAVTDLLHAQSAAVDLSYYEDSQYYDTLHRAQREAPWRPTQIVYGLTRVVQNSISLVGILALLVAFNWVLTDLRCYRGHWYASCMPRSASTYSKARPNRSE